MSRIKRQYSTLEEVIHSITHGIGFAFSIAALVVLIAESSKSEDMTRLLSFIVYGSSLIIMYLFSTLYHSIPFPGVKQFLQKMDHSSIFILIAGTYTPITMIAFKGAWSWILFTMIWALAIFGLIYELVLKGKRKAVSLTLYISMGWAVVIAIKPMMEMLPPGLITLMFTGGVIYTGGVIFYVMKRTPFTHVIWHLFVLGGSIAHFLGIYKYLV